MTTMRNVGLVVAGALGGIALVLACGNGGGGMPDARGQDAAGCNCPPAPQPVEQRIRYVTVTDKLLSIQEAWGVAASCAAGSVVLGGSCYAGPADGVDVFLKSSEVGGTTYACIWENPNGVGGTDGIDIRATAVCLVPEGTPDAGL